MSTTFSTASTSQTDPVVTAEKYLQYKRAGGHIKEFTPPKIILICYQQSTLDYFLERIPGLKLSDSFSHLYLLGDGKVGILGGWGYGAPALANRMEQMIVLGVTQFIAVGTAGTLMDKHSIGEFIIAPKALAEDGVAHLYLKGESFAEADEQMLLEWRSFAKRCSLPEFQEANAWSFSAIFRETPADIVRVTQQGYDVVEMEAATLYAVGQEKKVQTLSLFVVSDSLTVDAWTPHLKEPLVRQNLHKLAEWALAFCKESATAKLCLNG